MTALLSTTYFGPIQWYQKLARYPQVLIERHDSYLKQTYRNRCLIATTNGVQALTVPVSIENGEVRTVRCSSQLIRVSDHGNWRHQHWQALTSAYGDSPFFQYYEDDLRPFFTERWELLYDFNEAIRLKMCELLDIHPHVTMTSEYERTGHFIDFRESINPKHPQPDADFVSRPYYQVYQAKHAFLPNLSILDLLCNMGNEAIFYL